MPTRAITYELEAPRAFAVLAATVMPKSNAGSSVRDSKAVSVLARNLPFFSYGKFTDCRTGPPSKSVDGRK